MTTSALRRATPATTLLPPTPVEVQPFLKWAGGKRQLLPALRTFYPACFGAYFEPFVGSGAVFFDLAACGLLQSHPAVLSDLSDDVIGCYRAIRRDVSAVVRALRGLEAGHTREGREHYYAIRDGQFNPLRAQRQPDASSGDPREYPAALAAMFIYLNRTGFNGLFRLNRRGDFNVPAGRYDRPHICDAENLRAVARTLKQPGVGLQRTPFDHVLDRACPGDFLYFDPPYAPVSPTARFTAYTTDGFGVADQQRLQQLLIALAGRGCHVLLSNSVAPAVSALYEGSPDAKLAGLRTWRVPARRAINSRASRRGPVPEFLVTNIEPADTDGVPGLARSLGVN
jgi:DNA adenine methylase